jgi:hypothetical protein
VLIIGVKITDLPERVRKYALQQIVGAPITKKQSKYKNKKTVVNEIKFDSKKEAQRYAELIEELKRGDITDLRLQQTYTLQESYMTVGGVRVKAIKYIADFSYLRKVDGNLRRVVEDVKSRGTRTPVYQMKRKMMFHKYGINITEV